MKYFSNLPKIDFESSIGSFSISDFFTYVDVNQTKIDSSPLSVDSKITLLELAHTIYKDVNSFWMFLLANNAINPFVLLSINNALFKEEFEPKTSLELSKNIAGTTSYVFPPGSIIAPYVQNTGGSYSYSSVGNFDLNGPFSIIESVSYHNKTMVIKDQRGATYEFISQDGTTGSPIVIISPGTGDNYTIEKQYYPIKTKSAINETVKVEVSAEGYIEDSISPVSYKKTSSTKEKEFSYKTPITLPSTELTQITALKLVELENKSINCYPVDQSSILKSLFTSAKYI